MLQDHILPSQPHQLSMQIDGCITRLADITLLAQPPRQRQLANTHDFEDIPPRPFTG
jgi:hypothetical protein